jgi:predicted ATPase
MSGPDESARLITHIRLRNWRNFVDVQADLGWRTIIAGPNASGKTNLLDALCFLRGLAAEGGGLRKAVRRRGGVHKLRCLSARQLSDVGILVRAGPEENTAHWEYELHFNQDRLSQPVVKLERLSRMGEDIIQRPDADDCADPERLTQSFLEQRGIFGETKALTVFLRSIRYVNVVPQLMREPDRLVSGRVDICGAGLLESMASTPARSRNARLRKILEAVTAAVPHLSELSVYRDERGRPHLRARYRHWRAKGAWQSEDQFSDGTLRLIGLLWTLLDAPGPVLMEEPELALHPRVVNLLPGILTRLQKQSGRQVLLTTSSPDFVEGEGVDPAEILVVVPAEEDTTVFRPLASSKVAALLRTETFPSPLKHQAEEEESHVQMELFPE